MKFFFLLVMLTVRCIMPSDNDGRADSSPEDRMLRSPLRSSLSPESASRGYFSDPGAEGVPIPAYLSPLGISGGSSSSSSFHSDSECEKWALSDRELFRIGQLADLVANKMYGSVTFQQNVYSVLDLNGQLSFAPAQGKTLGDLWFRLYDRQVKIDDQIKESTIVLERIRQANEQIRNSSQQMQDDVLALRNQVSDQQNRIFELCGTVQGMQDTMSNFHQAFRALVALITVMQQNKIAKSDDKSEQE